MGAVEGRSLVMPWLTLILAITGLIHHPLGDLVTGHALSGGAARLQEAMSSRPR